MAKPMSVQLSTYGVTKFIFFETNGNSRNSNRAIVISARFFTILTEETFDKKKKKTKEKKETC